MIGTSEDYGSDRAPIDYDRWPFYAALTAARRAGTLHGYALGVGADLLTLDVDLMTVLVFDAPFFDDEFSGLVAANDEGHLITRPFTAETVEQFARTEAMQPAGATWYSPPLTATRAGSRQCRYICAVPACRSRRRIKVPIPVGADRRARSSGSPMAARNGRSDSFSPVSGCRSS